VLPHGYAEVIVPPRTPAAEVTDFIAASREWIEKTRRRAIGNGAAADLSLPTIVHLPAAEETWHVTYRQSDARSSVEERSRPGGGDLFVGVAGSRSRRAMRTWLINRARPFLLRRVDVLAQITGLRPRGVSIRRQRTRWGSCTHRRRININCAAMFLSQALVDYLIVHELCHLRFMNHSRNFWALVNSFEPDYRKREAELSDSWNAVPGWVFYEP
jgi:predicted metal-dependent hydrolase